MAGRAVGYSLMRFVNGRAARCSRGACSVPRAVPRPPSGASGSQPQRNGHAGQGAAQATLARTFAGGASVCSALAAGRSAGAARMPVPCRASMGGDRQSGQGTEADLGAAAAPQRRGEAASSAGNGSTSESVSVSFVSVESSETVMVRGNGADGPGKSVGDAEPGSLPGSLGAAGVGGNGSSGVHLNMGVFMIPHPDKAHKGGEDAFFLCEDCGGGAAGVADGVGGWAEQGVDSGQYSRALCENTRAACHGVQPELNSPKAALKVAHAQTEGLGSSTACVLMMGADGTLHIANLGDSGVMIVREGKPVFVTPQQQHDFNFPFQLGSEPFNDPPESADDFAVKVQPGDVVVAATDGLWDNMYVDEVANLIADSRSRGHSPREAAREVATRAQVLAADDRYLSPFAYSALQLGYVFIGGKMDDITVLVSYVEEGKAKL